MLTARLDDIDLNLAKYPDEYILARETLIQYSNYIPIFTQSELQCCGGSSAIPETAHKRFETLETVGFSHLLRWQRNHVHDQGTS
jgi:hypothetical protein